jgi:Heavy-metal-associated domain
MRAIVCALVGVVLVVSAARAGEVQTRTSSPGSRATCSAAVTKVLLQVRGVRSVEVSEDRQHARVIADEPAPPRC